MFRWSLMLRKLFTSSSSVSDARTSNRFRLTGTCLKTRRPRQSVRPSLEVIEDRILPSATSVNPLGTVVLASPPPVPSVAAMTSYVSSTMDQVERILATVEQVVRTAEQILTLDIAQAEGIISQRVDNVLGIPTGSSAGSGSGGGAATIANSAPNQQLNTGIQKIGSGSGSGATATAHDNNPTHGVSKIEPMTGSGSGSGGGGTSGVYGQVWLDNNGDNSEDDGEMGFSGVQVNLWAVPDVGGPVVVATTTTDGNGNYVFTHTPAYYGNYEINVVFPLACYAVTPSAQSVINAQGYSQVFALAPGVAVNAPAGMKSMNVTILQDDPNGIIQNQITLRDAIQTGNDGPPARAVTFIDRGTGKGLNGTISLQKALDPIKTSYNIEGTGTTNLFVEGNGKAGTIFTINAGVTSTISSLTITGGSGFNGGGVNNNGELTLNSVDVEENQASGNGGGIWNDNSAELQLQGVLVSLNTATVSGGGLDNDFGTVIICCGSVINSNTASGGGGGIYNEGGTIETYDNTKIQNNKDTGSYGGGVQNGSGSFIMNGGSIYNNQELKAGGGGVLNSGTMTLSGVTIQSNKAATQGGGIYVNAGKLTVTRSTTIGSDTFPTDANKAASGGGMYMNGGTAKVSGSIVGNSATGVGGNLTYGGGGIYVSGGTLTLKAAAINGNTTKNNGGGNGGGIYIAGGTVKATSGSISDNQSDNNGGGIWVGSGSLTLTGKFVVEKNKTPHGDGGGMFIGGGKVSLSGAGAGSPQQEAWIEYNSGIKGGGIYNWGGSLTIQNNVQIYENDADINGGGMYFAIGSTTTLAGNGFACNITRNTIGGQGGQVVATKGQGAYRQVVAGFPPPTINNWVPLTTVDDWDDPERTYVSGP